VPQNQPLPNSPFPPSGPPLNSSGTGNPELKADSSAGRNSNPVPNPQADELKLQDLQKAIEQLKELAEKSGALAGNGSSPGAVPNETPGGPRMPNATDPNRRKPDPDPIRGPADIPVPPANDALPQPAAPSSKGSGRNPQAIDVPKELEQKGFGETLKKIVERAKQESRQPKPSSDGTAGTEGNGNADGQGSQELSQSMIRMLDRFKDDLVEIAKDSKFNERPQRREENPWRQPETPSPSGSTLQELRKAASEFLAAPKEPSGGNPAANLNPAAAGTAFDSQFDLTPVLILGTILAAAGLGFFGLRYLKFRTAEGLTLQLAGPAIQPSDIRTRADVVRAFHEFSLRSTKRVQAWWTHRAVERVIVESSPEKKAAVEALANAYEQARYLPHDHELSSEEIQAARNALQQCTAGVTSR